MVRITAVAASLSALYGAVQATPVAGKAPKAGQNGLELGYDPALKDLFGPDSIIPETILVSQKASRLSGTSDGKLPSAAPFIPPTESTGEKDKRFINGADDRRYNGDTHYPWSAIGKIARSDGSWCSAALVGPRHVLTAQHCIPGDDVSITFYPSYDIAPRLGWSPVVTRLVPGWDFPGSCHTKNDWAVLILQDRIGDNLGWFGTRWPDTSKFDQAIMNHQGYPQDLDGGARPYFQGNTTVRSDWSLECDASGPIITDNDVWGGQSGGPLWTGYEDGPYISGTLALSVTSSEVTFAVWGSGDLMVNAVIDARANYQ
ncbi:Glutamyl endopeptidase [Paramyrothecium foliicola]|nr:Glutamyl endopeptidase [Paramyrothecium foliicola]